MAQSSLDQTLPSMLFNSVKQAWAVCKNLKRSAAALKIRLDAQAVRGCAQHQGMSSSTLDGGHPLAIAHDEALAARCEPAVERAFRARR